MFICNHCPYVKAIIDKIVYTTNELEKFGIKSIAIMPNDTNKYPEDNFENMRNFSDSHRFNFPYLIDDTQKLVELLELSVHLNSLDLIWKINLDTGGELV